jgi:hypothetical protein
MPSRAARPPTRCPPGRAPPRAPPAPPTRPHMHAWCRAQGRLRSMTLRQHRQDEGRVAPPATATRHGQAESRAGRGACAAKASGASQGCRRTPSLEHAITRAGIGRLRLWAPAPRRRAPRCGRWPRPSATASAPPPACPAPPRPAPRARRRPFARGGAGMPPPRRSKVRAGAASREDSTGAGAAARCTRCGAATSCGGVGQTCCGPGGSRCPCR